MEEVWLRTWLGEYALAPAFGAEPLDAGEAHCVLSDAWERGGDSQVLRALAVAVQGRVWAHDVEPVAVLCRAVEEGALQLRRIETARPVMIAAPASGEPFDLVAAPLPEPAPAATWIALQILFADGRPYVDLPVTIIAPDGTLHELVTDGDARVRVEGLTPGTCGVRFEGPVLPPETGTPAPGAAADGVPLVVAQDGHCDLRIVAGREHVAVVQPPAARIVTIECGHDIIPAPVEGTASALEVLVAVRRACEDVPDPQIIVACHGEHLAATAANLLALIVGSEDAFGADCVSAGQDRDAQLALRWAAREHGWPCDPGPADDDFGPRCASAVRVFRQRAAERVDASPGEGAQMTAEDWVMMRKLYDAWCEAYLGVELAPWRASLVAAMAEPVALSDAWPTASIAVAGYPTEATDRLDVIVVPAASLPDDVEGAPPLASVYACVGFSCRAVPVVALDRGDATVCLILDLEVDADLRQTPGARLSLVAESHELSVLLADAASEDGDCTFVFEGVHSGAEYELIYDDDDGRTASLCDPHALDAFLGAIEDPDLDCEPLVLRPLPRVEPATDEPLGHIDDEDAEDA
ncbi:MAG: hypothetical protein AAF721_26475 [Myxococcota bacterium]